MGRAVTVRKMNLSGLVGLLMALALFGAACSSDDSDDTADTTAAPPSTESTDDTVDPEDEAGPDGFELEASSVTASVDDGPLATGVSVSWYASDGNYAFVFSGTDFSTIDLLCPGSSLESATGFSNVSNGPAVPGACEGWPTELPPTDPKVCGEILVAFSAIPLDGEGQLRGSLEAGSADAIESQSSAVEANGGDVPELDAGADVYVIDGTEYVCA